MEAMPLGPLAWLPSLATDTRVVVGMQLGAPRQVSRRKVSSNPLLVSLGTRFVALDTNATKRPSLLIAAPRESLDRKSTRLNSSHSSISYAVFCLKKKKTTHDPLSVISSNHVCVV